MAHAVETIDSNGEVVDVVFLCSDACHREYAGADYRGWYGCIELEFTDYCAQCGVVLPGIYQSEYGDTGPCDCLLHNVVVNRFPRERGERCRHGRWIQLPANRVASRR